MVYLQTSLVDGLPTSKACRFGYRVPITTFGANAPLAVREVRLPLAIKLGNNPTLLHNISLVVSRMPHFIEASMEMNYHLLLKFDRRCISDWYYPYGVVI